jgi:hypothetical protein
MKIEAVVHSQIFRYQRSTQRSEIQSTGYFSEGFGHWSNK